MFDPWMPATADLAAMDAELAEEQARIDAVASWDAYLMAQAAAADADAEEVEDDGRYWQEGE